MTKKRSKPVTPSSSPPKRDEMGENGRGSKNSSLSRRQQAALPVIAATPTLAQAARYAGIAESTLYRWLEDEDFRDELTRLRQASADIAKQELQGIMLRSVSTFAEALEHPDMGIRLRAARYAMAFAVQISEVEKLRADLQTVEDSLPPVGVPQSPHIQ